VSYFPRRELAGSNLLKIQLYLTHCWCKRKITHDPFYCISLADCYLKTDVRGMVRSELKRAIDMVENQVFEL
jgi:hypothetical protein